MCVGRWVGRCPSAAVIMIVCVSKHQQQQQQLTTNNQQLLRCVYDFLPFCRLTVYLFIYLAWLLTGSVLKWILHTSIHMLACSRTRSLSLSFSITLSIFPSFSYNLYTHHAALTSDLH